MLTQMISLVWELPPLVYVAIALATVWYWMTRSTLPDNVPPFPCKPYPILGHGPMMKNGPVEKIQEWRQSTGDIFGIYLGKQYVVVLNNLSLIKEALVKHADFFSDRPESFMTRNIKNGCHGLLSNSGPSWKEQRTVSMTILRKFGMGKNFLAEKISIEVNAYLDAVSDSKGEATDFRILTISSVSNVICAILKGDRFEFDDPYFIGLLKLLNEQVILIGNMALLNSFDWLKYFPGDLFKAKRIVENTRQIRNVSYKFVDDLQKENKEDVENFITAYKSEMEKKKKSNTPTFLDEDNLMVVVTHLFIAGSETTSSTLMWAMLFAMHYPEAQEKVYKEILDVIGPDRPPSMQDRPNMNYTNAYIMETQRIGSIVPLNLLHLCIKTSEVGGYTIPKDTVIIPNLDALLKDKETWGDPYVFRPERFLDKDNNLVVPEQFIPFSIGRRYCLGESLAKMELFLFFTGIFQRFHIKPEDPENLPPVKAIVGVTSAPINYKTRLIERRQE